LATVSAGYRSPLPARPIFREGVSRARAAWGDSHSAAPSDRYLSRAPGSHERHNDGTACRYVQAKPCVSVALRMFSPRRLRLKAGIPHARIAIPALCAGLELLTARVLAVGRTGFHVRPTQKLRTPGRADVRVAHASGGANRETG